MSQHLFHLPRLQHLHEGQGPARRPLHHQPHLRHLRRQSRHLRHLCAEYGVRREAAAHGRMDRQPGRSRRVHVRPQHLPGQPGGRGFLRADGQGDQSRRARQGREDRLAALQPARLPHHRRYHAGAQSLHRLVLPRSAADEPHDARDVLPDGRPARPSVHALSRRRGHRSHRAALHRLPGAPDEVRRVHEEGGAAARRPVRLLLRRAARVRKGGRAAHPARAAGDRSTIPMFATTPTRT